MLDPKGRTKSLPMRLIKDEGLPDSLVSIRRRNCREAVFQLKNFAYGLASSGKNDLGVQFVCDVNVSERFEVRDAVIGRTLLNNILFRIMLSHNFSGAICDITRAFPAQHVQVASLRQVGLS